MHTEGKPLMDGKGGSWEAFREQYESGYMIHYSLSSGAGNAGSICESQR